MAKPHGSTAAMRQVLMVAFHYPPIAGSAGALRSRAFASYLPNHGWRAHVLAPRTMAYAAVDSMAITPDTGCVHRSWALDARRHLGCKGRYLELTAVPDRWVSWAPSAIAVGLRIIRDHPIEAIWSTYPIATSHVIAASLARLTGLPWIAEFRDPVDVAACPPVQRWAQQAIERCVIGHADHTVFVTPSALADCRRRFPAAATRFSLIPNGYDESLEPAPAPPERGGIASNRPLRLLHSGHLYRPGRDPLALFEALARLKRRGSIDAEQLQIIFRNSQEESVYQDQIQRLDVGDMVTLAPWQAHKDVLNEQRAVDGLLLLQGAEFNRQVPAKFFEYLRSRRPVFALVDDDGDTAALLDELGGGTRVEIDDPAAIAEHLLYFLRRLRETGSNTCPWPVDEAALSQYSRAYQTAQLARILEEVS